MKYTDLLLVDIKHIDKEQHIELTGLPNDNIFDGFKYLSEISKPIWIRHVLVPGITDDDEYLKRTRAFIETLSNVQKIEVLPYHSMGQHKFETLGIPYKLDGVKSPSKERVDNAMKILNGK
jgi:pyruvate formate lyase activating enzyme